MNEQLPIALREYLDRMLAAIPAGASRQEEMREELLAHLLSVFAEECARGQDESEAVTATLLRFGSADDLNQEIRNTVPTFVTIWYHLFLRKENFMRWLFLGLGVIGFLVGAGFIMPALQELLIQAGVLERTGLHSYGDRGFLITLSIALLLFGCALTLGGAWSVFHGVKRFRLRGS